MTATMTSMNGATFLRRHGTSARPTRRANQKTTHTTSPCRALLKTQGAKGGVCGGIRSHIENETKTVIYKWNREERRGRRRRETRTRASQDVAVAVEVDALGLRANEGNWKGILCNLNRDGSPQELPPMYVPDALREWGETLYEWNTLCESLVVETNHDDGSTSNTLTQDVKRQVPLTACESVEIQFETIGRVSTEVRTHTHTHD